MQVKNLSTYFFAGWKITKVVDGVTLEIDEGEVVAVVGESGSGKTVLALSIARLIEPEGKIVGGEILWKGFNILNLSEAEMQKIRGREIGFVFQDVSNSLNPVLKVGKQVEEIFHVKLGLEHSRAKEETLRIFESVGIKEPEKVYNLYPHQLSGGLKQRVIIAIAFAPKPKLVIADEPTSFVDAVTQKQIINLFRVFKNEYKISILLITHNFGIVSEIADRVYVMRRGKIVEEGKTFEIINSPRHPYTANLVQSAKILSL